VAEYSPSAYGEVEPPCAAVDSAAVEPVVVDVAAAVVVDAEVLPPSSPQAAIAAPVAAITAATLPALTIRLVADEVMVEVMVSIVPGESRPRSVWRDFDRNLSELSQL
jgi:hypothetical protein